MSEKSNNQKELSELFKTLMHPVRLEILELLRQREECVCHMEVQLKYRQAYISQHLAVLREAGLIQDRRDGWNIFYRVTRPEIYMVIDQARYFTGQALNYSRQVERLADCPCPKCAGETG
ncbi:MAG TPA: metalloregulator ArsR/SmtB family transcription factor [Chloroflexia bacterium]|nr:metalloregulator ArsR/SmtB family transcription factor [Chloroflexia bacterium]